MRLQVTIVSVAALQTAQGSSRFESVLRLLRAARRHTGLAALSLSLRSKPIKVLLALQSVLRLCGQLAATLSLSLRSKPLEGFPLERSIPP